MLACRPPLHGFWSLVTSNCLLQFVLGQTLQPLRLLTTRPAHRELLVPQASELVLTFSEHIQAGGGSLKVLGCGINASAVTQISAKSTAVNLNGKIAKVTLPSQTLVTGRCEVSADNKSFADSSGSLWKGVDEGSWVFSLAPVWKTRPKPPLLVGTRWAQTVLVVDGVIVVLGGRNEFRYFNDVWHSRDFGKSWSLVAPECPWSRRSASSSVSLKNSTLILLGGFDGNSALAEVWVGPDLGKRAELWSERSKPPWSPREEFGAALLGENVFVTGGYSGGMPLNDVWVAKSPHLEWSAVGVAGFSPRASFVMLTPILRPGCLLVLGGTDSVGVANGEAFQSCRNGTDWQLLTQNAPFAGIRRFRVVQIAADGSLHMLGGHDMLSTPPANSGKWAVSLDGGVSWSIRSREAPARSDFGLAASDKSELLVVGGHPGNLQDVWIHQDPIETRIVRSFPAAGARDIPYKINVQLLFTEAVQVDTSWGNAAEIHPTFDESRLLTSYDSSEDSDAVTTTTTTTTTEPPKVVKLLTSSARIRGKEVTFALTELHPSQKYVLSLPNGLFRDFLGGDGFGTSSSQRSQLEFTTLSKIHCGPQPEWTSAEKVGSQSGVFIVFSDNIKPHDGVIVVTGTYNGEFSHSFLVTDYDVVQIREKSMKLIPRVLWESGAWHSVRIPRGTLKDVNGFLLDECFIPNAFRAADWQIPRVVGLTPPNGGARIDMRRNKLLVNFSEAVKVGKGYVTILPRGKQRSVEINVQNRTLVSAAGTVATIRIPVKLQAPQRIAVSIDAGAFVDLNNNHCEQLTAAEWTFGIRDFVGPLVLKTEPKNREVNVQFDVTMRVEFSEDVELSRGTVLLKEGASKVRHFTVRNRNSSRFSASNDMGEVSVDMSEVSISPSKPLLPDTTYVLSVPEGVFEDRLGNPNEEFQITFWTIPSRPFLLNASTDSGRTIKVDEPLLLTFNEDVVPGKGWIILAPSGDDAGQKAVALNITDPQSCNIYRNNVTLNPAGRVWLQPNMAYSLHVLEGSIVDEEAGEPASWPRDGHQFVTSWREAPVENSRFVSTAPKSVVMPDTFAVVGHPFTYAFSRSLLIDDSHSEGIVWNFSAVHAREEVSTKLAPWLQLNLHSGGILVFSGLPGESGNVSVRVTAAPGTRLPVSVIATFRVSILEVQFVDAQRKPNESTVSWWFASEGATTAWALSASGWFLIISAPAAYLFQKWQDGTLPRKRPWLQKKGNAVQKPKPILVIPSTSIVPARAPDSPQHHPKSPVTPTGNVTSTGRDSPVTPTSPIEVREPEDDAVVRAALQKIRNPAQVDVVPLSSKLKASSTLRPESSARNNQEDSAPNPVALKGMLPSSLRPKWLPSSRQAFNNTFGSSGRVITQVHWKPENQESVPLSRLELLAQQNKRQYASEGA